MNNLIRLRDGRLYGVLSIACILAGCSGVGSTASTPTSQSAPAVVTASPTSAATTKTVLPAPVVPANNSGTVSVSWIPPTENTDGSVLMNLGGYVIHYGTASKTYTSTITLTNPGLTLYVIESLPAGTYYFAMTARTTSGVESSLSAEASTTIS
jgi:hypothetical protein